jgi:hypothetical protein
MDNRKRVEVAFDGGSLTLIERKLNWDSRREFEAAPRMYVSVSDETLVDDLMNRRRRPYNVYKTLIHSSGLKTILDLTKLSWSQYAGCSCPCSPGFVLKHQRVSAGGHEFAQWDAWLTLTGAPAVDLAKPARDLALV